MGYLKRRLAFLGLGCLVGTLAQQVFHRLGVPRLCKLMKRRPASCRLHVDVPWVCLKQRLDRGPVAALGGVCMPRAPALRNSALIKPQTPNPIRGDNQGRKSTPLIALNLYSPDRTKKQTRTRIRATQGGRKGGRNPHPYLTLRTQALLFELVAFCSSSS